MTIFFSFFFLVWWYYLKKTAQHSTTRHIVFFSLALAVLTLLKLLHQIHFLVLSAKFNRKSNLENIFKQNLPLLTISKIPEWVHCIRHILLLWVPLQVSHLARRWLVFVYFLRAFQLWLHHLSNLFVSQLVGKVFFDNDV